MRAIRCASAAAGAPGAAPQRCAPTSISTSTSSVTPAAFAAAPRWPIARGIVDEHADRRLLRERREARELGGADDLVGDEHVADARGDERLRLADFLAADAGGPALDLQLGDRGALVRLRVRAQRDARAVRRVRHQVEVALEGVEVDDERGRVDVVDGVADAGGDSLHDRHRTAQRRRARCAPLAPRPPHRQRESLR